MRDLKFLEKKSAWLRAETLKIHKVAPDTRVASSLSPVEILTALYYGGFLKHSRDPRDENRDRLIISKAHGAVCMYPILAELGYFDKSELEKVSGNGVLLGGIPDSSIPGFETTNGSLGHGPGVACGVALALKNKKSSARVFVLLGDGELFEGSVWEAVMFAGHHKLDNLTFLLDNNKICMLDFCRKIVDLEPLEDKFAVYKWAVQRADGHDAGSVCDALEKLIARRGSPGVLIADTVKGKGVECLEGNPLCHVRALSHEEADTAARRTK